MLALVIKLTVHKIVADRHCKGHRQLYTRRHGTCRARAENNDGSLDPGGRYLARLIEHPLVGFRAAFKDYIRIWVQ